MRAGSMKVSKTIEIEVEGLGERIKAARLASDKSLIKICEEAGLTRTYWYAIEGEANQALPVETLRKIERVLGVDFGVSFE